VLYMKANEVTRIQLFLFKLYFFLEHFLGLKNFNKLFYSNRQKLIDSIDARLKDSNRGRVLDIPIVIDKNIDNEVLNKKYLQNIDQPVLFKNAASDWKSVRNWSYQYFKDNYGDSPLNIIDNVGLVDRNSPQDFEYSTFGKYLEELEKGSKKYLKFSRIMDEQSNLKDDFNKSWLEKFSISLSSGKQFLMFIGGAKSMTPIHSGFAQTLFIQITGRKKWILWPSKESIFLNPRAERRTYNFTHADPYQLDDPNFPLLKYAQRYELVLEPGDVLWFPSHMWHQVENIDGGISVAYKFINLPLSFKSSKLYTFLFFFATKPFILKDLFYRRAKKEEYIFIKSQNDL
jgi:hypothetical protein